MKHKATQKQILNAYGQSYELMQKAKRHDDKIKNESKELTEEQVKAWDYLEKKLKFLNDKNLTSRQIWTRLYRRN